MKVFLPLQLLLDRFLIAGAFFLIALFVKKRITPDYDLGVKRKDLLILLVLALTGVTFFFTVQYTGIQLAGAGLLPFLYVCFRPY